MEFRILGPLEVTSAGKQVRIGGARQQRLLALLLLNVNRVVGVDRLIDQLWDDPPASARQQVHNAIGTLRRTLSDHSSEAAVVWTDAGYRLELPTELVDVHCFSRHVDAARRAVTADDLAVAIESLRAGIDLWRGDALAGLTGPAFDNAAARLTGEKLTAIEELLSLRVRNGETSSVVSELQQLVAEYPLRESLRISLIRALHISGRRTDALEVYQAGRNLLAEELGLDPSPSLQQAHAEVLNGQPDATALLAPAEASPVPSSAQGMSNEPAVQRFYLPRDTSDFSGRSTELLSMLRDAKNTSPTALTISAVDGMGGVGKTTLAVHFGHQVSEEYPDGHYFVDLRGFTSGAEPVTHEQALDALLCDSGLPPELIPSGVDSKSATWRSRVAEQRVLLILDNAADVAHVRPLLPGSAAALVVVTSRRKLSALEGAQAVSLDVLPLEDAVALFRKVVGAERTSGDPEAVASAVDLCGRLPLAICIAAARLRDRAGWTVADLVKRLADHTQRVRFLRVDDRCVMTALKLSYKYLSLQQQLVFRTLSLHPGGEFDPYVAAALADISVDDAEDCMDTLFECNLLKQSSAGRFYFHDLIRDCARELLNEVDNREERDRALHRMFDYYLHTAHSLSTGLHNVIYDGSPQVDRVPEKCKRANSLAEAIEALNEEYPNLVSVARLALDGNWHQQAWQLVCTLQPYFDIRNYGSTAYALFQGGANAARAMGDVYGESACLRGLVAVCRDLGSAEEARQHLERSIELTRKLKDVKTEAAQLVQLGNLHLHEDRFEEARDVYLKAQPLADSDPTGFLRTGIAINLGTIARDLGEYDQALTSLQQALAMTAEDSPDSILFTRWCIGTVLHHLGRHEQALDEFNHGLHTSRKHKIQRSEALALVGLANAHRSLGNLGESLSYGRQSLLLTRTHDLRATECEALNALGETTVALLEADQAEQVFEQAVERARRYGFARYEARAMDGFAHVSLLRGDLDAALRHWQMALDTYPDGFADRRYAEQHLASLDRRGGVCFRCETADQASGVYLGRIMHTPA